MGVSLGEIERLERLGLLGRSVLDIGSSNLYSAVTDRLTAFLERRGCRADITFAERLAAGSAYDSVRGGLNGAFLGELLERAGIDYRSLDIADGYRTTILDLNHARLPRSLRGRFDLVLNFGTTEHILNQYNCFKIIHDATKVGGHIVHSVPALGFVDHGYVAYTGRCFFDLAGYNGYEITECSFSEPEGRNSIFESVQSYRSCFPALERTLADRSDALRSLPVSNVSLSVIYRKVHDAPFRGALEKSTSVGVIPGRMTEEYSPRVAWKRRILNLILR
jgi:hypothetical protein